MNFKEKSTILIIDDTPANVNLLANLIKDTYIVKVANNGKKGLEIALQAQPDMILLDVMMPVMDGWETCQALKSNTLTQDIPVIFLTAKNSIEDEMYGLALGAVDFILKPISPPIVLARIKTHLQNKMYQDFLKDESTWLKEEVNRKLSQIYHLQDASMMVMISMAEFRDECTGWHIKRTQEFVGILAQKLSHNPDYRALLTPEYIEQLKKSAPLHDIGKIAIPDTILLKPGKLSDDEMDIMKTHAQKGVDILMQAQNYFDTNSEFLITAIEISGGHHEKWDGSGYPKGLRETKIPLSARLMAVADVYDALTNARPYKKAFSHEKAISIMQEMNGTHFDPLIMQIFEDSLEEFKVIATTWNDNASPKEI